MPSFVRRAREDRAEARLWLLLALVVLGLSLLR
jgi:hypothetical protein